MKGGWIWQQQLPSGRRHNRVRLMGFLFLCLTFLAGITVGTVEIALINVVVFLGLALLAIRFIAPRFGNNGVVFAMAGAFFVSFMWPAVVMLLRSDAGCQGDNCLPAPDPDAALDLRPAT